MKREAATADAQPDEENSQLLAPRSTLDVESQAQPGDSTDGKKTRSSAFRRACTAAARVWCTPRDDPNKITLLPDHHSLTRRLISKCDPDT